MSYYPQRDIYTLTNKTELYKAIDRAYKRGGINRQRAKGMKGKIKHGQLQEVANELNTLCYFTEVLFE